MNNVHNDKKRPQRVKSILVSQPKPRGKHSPYFVLAEKYGIEICFRPFIKVESVGYKTFRKQKIDIAAHTALIFTSRNAVDHFFRLLKEAKLEMSSDTKYFCVTEQTANYLQKYIAIRKRKVFTGQRTAKDLLSVLKKHKHENYLFPCSDIRTDDIPGFLREKGYRFTEAVIYRTVADDLSDLADVNYDVIAFFSPSGIRSLFSNFPDFKQQNTRIAAFGPTTANAVEQAKLTLDIRVPRPDVPSMTGALERYIKEVNGHALS